MREVRPTFWLSLPIVAGMLSHMLMGLVDTIMVGRVGVVPLAASALVNALAHIPMVFFWGLLSSVSVLAAQAFGGQRREEAGEVFRHGLVLAIGAGGMILLSVICLRPFLNRFGQPPEVARAAGNYLILFGASMGPALIAHTCKQFSEALNRPWAPNFLMFAAVLLNVFLNWILIYGHWGFSALGLEGAGWATLIARFVMAIALIVYVLTAAALKTFRPNRWWAGFSGDLFRRLLGLGGPVAAQHLLEVSAFVYAALMMGWISSDAMASHQIALSCAATTFMFPLGIAMATCIRVGQAWGARKLKRTRTIGFAGICMAATVMAGFGLIFVTAGEQIANCFVASPAVARLTAKLLLIAAVFQIADGIQVAAISGLRGVNDVRLPAIIAGCSYWFVAVPLAYVLAFPVRLGGVGIWIGLAFGLIAAAIGLSWRFHLRTRFAG